MARFRSLLADAAWRRVAVVLLAAIGMQLAALTVPARAEGALFSDSFETGDLSAWSLRRGLVVQSAEVFSGAYAARMTYNGTGIETYADKTLGPGLSSVYYRLRFKIISQGPENVNLLSLGPVTVGLSSAGKLLYRHRLGTRRSAITVERGVWHTLQVHVLIAGDQSRVETFYDGAPVAALTSTESLGTTPIHKVQLGESSRGLQPYDVAFDDVAVATSFIGDSPAPSDTQPPTPPGDLTATATGPDTIALSWTAASDDVGVAGYEIERDGGRLATLGPSATGHADTALGAGEMHTYRVVAVDAAGNRSQPAGPVSATTPQAAALFTDGFESGALSQWFKSAGVTVIESPVRSGRYAARAIAAGGPAYAYAALSRPATDISVRLNVQIAGPLSTTAYLLKLRTDTGASIGGLYLTSRGALAFRNDVTGASTTSTTVLAPGTWYDLKLRLAVGEGKVAVWLNGAPVAALTRADPLGGAAIGRLQIGDISPGRTFDLAFDDVTVGCSC